MLRGIATMKSRIGEVMRCWRPRRRSEAVMYPAGSAIATAASERLTLFQIADVIAGSSSSCL